MSDESASDFATDGSELLATFDRSDHPRKARRTVSYAEVDVVEHADNIYDENYIARRAAMRNAYNAQVEARMMEQRDGSNSALAKFFDTKADFHKLPCAADLIVAPGYHPANVLCGDGILEINNDVCAQLVKHFDHPLSADRRAKGFQHYKFQSLLDDQACRPFLYEWKRVMDPLSEYFRFAHAHLVVTRGNQSWMHRDAETGKIWFERAEFDGSYADGAFPSWRILFDIGSFAPTPPRRRMVFEVNKTIVFETRARFVAMDLNTAGSGEKSNIFHGRIGDGVTASCDLVLPAIRGPVDGDTFSRALRDGDRHIRDFFHGAGVSEPCQLGGRIHQAKRSLDELHEKVNEAQARASAAEELVERGEWPLERRHCWRCGSHETRVADGYEKWHGRGEDNQFTYCDACRHDFDRSSRRSDTTTRASYGNAEPKVVRLFFCPPGCTGCVFVPLLKYVPAATLAAERARAAEAAARADAGADVPLVLNHPHCHFCGKELPADAAEVAEYWNATVLDDSEPPKQLARCFGCRKQHLAKKVLPPRNFSCAPQCTGCRRPFKPKLSADEAARERAAAALGGRAEAVARDEPHCHTCGLTLPAKEQRYLRKKALQDDKGVWLLHCSGCIKQWTQKKLTRQYFCPPSCPGCRCQKEEEVKPTK